MVSVKLKHLFKSKGGIQTRNLHMFPKENEKYRKAWSLMGRPI